jgi:hypothetical protein
MKTVGVMQPYFFPYLGYFQLVAASTIFVHLDDVAFIKGGWINRNRVLVQGNVHTISVPVRGASSHRIIRATPVAEEQNWRTPLLRLLEQAYARAPFRDQTLRLVERTICATYESIGALAEESIRAVCRHVGLSATWQRSSVDHPPRNLTGTARILAICRALGANRYINAPGGRHLYAPEVFAREGIELRFLRPVLPRYPQASQEYISGLSIIDVLMCNPPEQVRQWMEAHELE